MNSASCESDIGGSIDEGAGTDQPRNNRLRLIETVSKRGTEHPIATSQVNNYRKIDPQCLKTHPTSRGEAASI